MKSTQTRTAQDVEQGVTFQPYRVILLFSAPLRLCGVFSRAMPGMFSREF